MLDFFDMRTLIFTSGVTSFVLFICMIYIGKKQKTYPGFLQWTVASLTNAAGMILISQIDFLPEFFTVLVANFLLMMSMILIVTGLRLFTDRKPHYRLYAAVMGIFVCAMLYFTYMWPIFNFRVIIYSLIQAALCVDAAYILDKYLPAFHPQRDPIACWFFIICTIFLILRAIVSAIAPQASANMITSGFFNQIVIIAGLEMFLIAYIGLMILNSQRINYELINTKNEIKTLTGFIPICANCKKIRDDKGSWNKLESYLSRHIDVEFSHGICPECMDKLYPQIPLKKQDNS